MARNIPFRIEGECIDCGGDIYRDSRTLRCEDCHAAMSKLRGAAISAVAKAVASGSLPLASECVCSDCGAQARDYDHRDYLRPLDVTAVCRPCNHRRGPANWQQPATAKA